MTRAAGRAFGRYPLLLVLAVCAPSAASAQDDRGQSPGPLTAALTPVRLLQAAEAPEPTQESEPKRRGWHVRWDYHPSLRFGRDTRIDFRARFQVDVRESEAPVGDVGDVDLARRRIGVDGRIAGLVDFQVEGELANDDPWRDVYADFRQWTVFRVQVGHFKQPFSLDENTSAVDLDFVYRSRAAAQLAPGRDWGVMVHGRLLRSTISYEAGRFDHDGRNARTDNPNRVYGNTTFAGRVTAQPFRHRKTSSLSELEVGVAGTESDVPEGFASIRGRTALDAPFFPADLWVQGRRQRLGLEARWQPGPYSVKAEYIRVSTERAGQGVDDRDLSPLIASGWYVSGTWAVTGEAKADGLDRPRTSILRGGVGTIELAARIEALGFRSAASGEPPSTSPRADVIAGNRDRVVTLGVNWFPLRWIKIQANLLREAIADAAEGPLPSKSEFWSMVMRFQLSI